MDRDLRHRQRTLSCLHTSMVRLASYRPSVLEATVPPEHQGVRFFVSDREISLAVRGRLIVEICKSSRYVGLYVVLDEGFLGSEAERDEILTALGNSDEAVDIEPPDDGPWWEEASELAVILDDWFWRAVDEQERQREAREAAKRRQRKRQLNRARRAMEDEA